VVCFKDDDDMMTVLNTYYSTTRLSF